MANLILNKPKLHAILPDSHAAPGHHNRRYEWFAKFLNDVKPDVVVDIGDFWSMDSLCSYDRGTKSFEGRRYRADIEAGLDAQERIYDITRKSKKKLPRFVRTLGNHEQRIAKAVERDPVLEGTIGLEDLRSKDYGWEEYPFLQSVQIDGVNYAHYFVSGVAGRPVPSATAIVQKKLESCTMGHVHTFDHCVKATESGRRIHGLFCGVFQDYDSGYAGPANKIWDRGVALKHDVQDGNYDLEWISMERLRKAYG